MDITNDKINSYNNRNINKMREDNYENNIKNNIQNEKKPDVPKYKIIICRIIAILMLIIAIVILVRAVVYKQYDICGFRFYMIMSGSMEDTIETGDGVISKLTKNIEVGDIIAFKMDNITTVHRITKIYTEGDKKLYKTKGDNNNAEDRGIIKQEDIQGKVVLRLPKVGKIILFLQRNIFMVLIILVSSIAILYIIRKMLVHKNT